MHHVIVLGHLVTIHSPKSAMQSKIPKSTFHNLLYLGLNIFNFKRKRKIVMSKKIMIGNIDVTRWYLREETKNDLQKFVSNDPTLPELK